MIVLPDVEKLVIDYLKTHSSVTALIATRVFSHLPKHPDFPAATVVRLGGSPAFLPNWLDVARIQVDVWGGTKKQARDAAATIQAALGEIPASQPLGVVTAVETTSGPTWFPDGATDRPRYTTSFNVYAHP